MIIDTHSHLYWDTFQENFDEYLQRAIDNGVTGFFNVGVDIESSEKALQQVEGVLNRADITTYSSIGIHPHEYVNYISDKAQVTSDKLETDIKKLEEIYNQNPQKVKLVGECGLDFFLRHPEASAEGSLANTSQNKSGDSSPSVQNDRERIKETQKKLFQAQIDLAEKLNLPLSIHCRDDRSQDPENTECWDAVIDMTKDHFGIYHCYSGLSQTTKRVLEETRFLVSFAGNLTYPRNQYLREAVEKIPLDRIVVETDCPFLPPQSHRGQQNEPSFITETVACIAKIKGLPVEKISQITSENALRLISS